MKYPEWAPPELVQLHKLEVQPDRVEMAPERGRVLEALLFGTDMEDVWKRVRERKARFEERLADPTSAENLLLLGPIFDAGCGSDPLPSGAEILARHLDETDRIRKSQALSLFEACAKALRRYRDISGWIHEDAQEVYTHIERFSELLATLLEYVPWGNSVIDDWEGLLVPDDFAQLTESLQVDDEFSLRTFLQSFGDVGELAKQPRKSFPALLRGLAAQARKSRANVRREVSQPNSATAERNHFIREVIRYFLRAYGTQLYKSVATIACAVFDDEDMQIDEMGVRALWGYRPGGDP